ncbi:MAG: hypothetical protein NTU81_03470 [Candidatus Nomurabacteria bacterium]|nr:hypothetical protein [Candidatus Nomurabacteria bacterium]
MGFLFTSKKKERIVAIFDIGSDSIGGAIVRIPLDGKIVPEIIKSIKNVEIKFRENLDFDLMMLDMNSALYSAAKSLHDKKSGAPDEIFCVMASPWYLSETRVIKLKKENPFIFSKSLATKLIKNEVSNLVQIFKNKYGESEGLPEIIEQNIMSVSLDDSVEEEPLGKRCKSLEMNMLVSLVPKIYLDKMREELSKIYHSTNVSFSSFTMATYLAVRDRYVTEDSYLLLDVSGEITDIGIVSKGVLKTVLSFPFGKRTVFKQICSKMNIELRDAKELFNLYNDKNLSKEHTKKLDLVIESIEKSWNDSFNQCIGSLPSDLVLSNTIFFTADNDIMHWFTQILNNEKYLKSKFSSRKFKIVAIEGSEFLNMCSVGDGICDPFIMIESISVMRKIVK